MIIADDEAKLAYTYAWWLTGNDEDAATAVLAAVDRPEVPGADDELRLEILLRRVRAASITTPTMCPASELSLLHDGIGLTLDSAAGLAMIDSREARTELAHGRLEALDEDVLVEVVEPERLGGLAVGNPADIAAARQNPKLEKLRELIMAGRDEMVLVSPIETPAALLSAIASRRGAQTTARWTGALGVADVTDDTPDTLLDPIGADEVPTAASEGHEDAPAPDSDAPDSRDPDDKGPDDKGPDAKDADSDGPDSDGPPPDSPTSDPAPPEATEPDTTTGPPPRSRIRPAADDVDAEEVDLSGQVVHEPPPLGVPRSGASRAIWLAVGLAVVVAVIVLLTGRSNDGDFLAEDGQADDPTLTVPDEPLDPTAAADPTTPATDADQAASEAPSTDTPATTAEGTEAPLVEDPVVDAPTERDPASDIPAEPRGLALLGTGVAVGLGADPVEGNPSATPFDPVSFVVTYSGAAVGDALVANWTVDGVQFDVERVDLLPGERNSRFSQQVPQDGWPLGQHTLTFTIPGQPEVLGEVTFVVVAEDSA